jgi:hypothetical protein
VNIISIYPNPNNGKFIISVDTGINKIEIYDILGQLIHQVEYMGEKKDEEVDLSLMSSGMYEIKIENEKKIIVRKVIIHKF